MAFYIFKKNSLNVDGTIYKIAANQEDLNSLLINTENYKIIENNEQNFEEIKCNLKYPLNYDNNNNITFINNVFKITKLDLIDYFKSLKFLISSFLQANPNHEKFQTWNSYLQQIESINVETLNYPILTSFEEYLKNNNKPYFNILQLP